MRIDYAWDRNTSSVGGTTIVSQFINGRWREVSRLTCTGTESRLETCPPTSTSGAAANVDLRRYDDIYLQMTVSATDRTLRRELDTRERYGFSRVMTTNNPNYSNFLFVDGVQQPHGREVDIQGDIPCGEWSNQNWEDRATYRITGPYTGPLAVNGTDFADRVQGSCGFSTETTRVRLAR